MAQIEMNALSVITCGSITVRIFLPGMDKLALDDSGHTKKYPVVWLLHDDGESSVQWLASPAERLSEKYGIFIICPEQHHALCTNMKYGPKYEDFLKDELPGIIKNNLPVSTDPKDQYIGGIGTGAYGALKMALKYPGHYKRAFAVNGILNMEEIFRRAVNGEELKIPHTKASLEAVFGDFNNFHGSENDLLTLAERDASQKKDRYLLILEESDPFRADNERFAALEKSARLQIIPDGSDCFSCQTSLPAALKWIFK